MNNVIYLAGRDQRACIVLVERDPLVRMALATPLRQAGLSVLEAVDSSEALTLLRSGRTIAVVLGELNPDAAAAIGREFAEVKLLVECAGDSPSMLHGDAAMVGRPYNPPKLLQTINALLSQPKIQK